MDDHPAGPGDHAEYFQKCRARGAAEEKRGRETVALFSTDDGFFSFDEAIKLKNMRGAIDERRKDRAAREKVVND